MCVALTCAEVCGTLVAGSEMDLVRGRVPSRFRVASSVAAIRTRFRESLQDHTTCMLLVNKLLQQTTVCELLA